MSARISRTAHTGMCGPTVGNNVRITGAVRAGKPDTQPGGDITIGLGIEATVCGEAYDAIAISWVYHAPLTPKLSKTAFGKAMSDAGLSTSRTAASGSVAVSSSYTCTSAASCSDRMARGKLPRLGPRPLAAQEAVSGL